MSKVSDHPAKAFYYLIKILGIINLGAYALLSFLLQRLHMHIHDQVLRFHPSVAYLWQGSRTYIAPIYFIVVVVMLFGSVTLLSLNEKHVKIAAVLSIAGGALFAGELLLFGWEVGPWFKASVFL